MNYFITAIGTDSGKTLISAALARALNADYWKPIQAGFPTDSSQVKEFTNGKVKIHEERHVLNTPASPHLAAQIDGVSISLDDFFLPKTHNNLIIEGAGGCLVPINSTDSVIDIAPRLNAEVIVVSNNYLGSINHTLLTLEYLKSINITPKAIIFNGEPNQSTEDIILKRSNIPCLLKVGQLESADQNSIDMLSDRFKQRWNELGW